MDAQANLRLLEEMDHYFARAPSYQASLRAVQGEATAEFDDRIYDEKTGPEFSSRRSASD